MGESRVMTPGGVGGGGGKKLVGETEGGGKPMSVSGSGSVVSIAGKAVLAKDTI